MKDFMVERPEAQLYAANHRVSSVRSKVKLELVAVSHPRGHLKAWIIDV